MYQRNANQALTCCCCLFFYKGIIIVFSLQVPIRQTIYTPAKTMHSRNYLRYSVFNFKII